MLEQLVTVGVLAVVMSLVINAAVQSHLAKTTKACQFCKGRINKEATACPHCTREQSNN